MCLWKKTFALSRDMMWKPLLRCCCCQWEEQKLVDGALQLLKLMLLLLKTVKS
jgi:hypothetical protein